MLFLLAFQSVGLGSLPPATLAVCPPAALQALQPLLGLPRPWCAWLLFIQVSLLETQAPGQSEEDPSCHFWSHHPLYCLPSTFPFENSLRLVFVLLVPKLCMSRGFVCLFPSVPAGTALARSRRSSVCRKVLMWWSVIF